MSTIPTLPLSDYDETDSSAPVPSPDMWPTPQAHDAAQGDPTRVGRYGTKHGGRNLTDEVHLWPTPSACNANDGEGAQTWLARRERLKAKGINGNGAGIPLAIAAQAPEECAPAPSTSSTAGHHASHLQRQVSALVRAILAGDGPSSCASLASWHPGMYWQRIQLALFPCDMQTASRPLDEYCTSYPRWGTVAAGESGRPLMSALRIDATECSSSPDKQTWATPASSWTEGRGTTRPETWVKRQQARVDQGKQPFADPLHVQVARQAWPTPTIPNGGRSPRGGISPTGMTPQGIKRQVDLGHHVRMVEQQVVGAMQAPSGHLNPAWVAQLQGFPEGWLDIPGPPAPAKRSTRTRHRASRTACRKGCKS